MKKLKILSGLMTLSIGQQTRNEDDLSGKKKIAPDA